MDSDLERQPLLLPPAGGGQQAAARRACGRCLFLLTDFQTVLLLFALFLVDLIVQGDFPEWVETLKVTIYADVLWLLLLIVIALMLGVMVAAVRRSLQVLYNSGDYLDPFHSEYNRLTCQVFWTLVLANLAWWITLRISQYHKVGSTCWLPHLCLHATWLEQDTDARAAGGGGAARAVGARQGLEAFPDLYGPRQFLLAWTWLPTGLLECVAGVFWRPWWFLVCLPLSFFGKGPLVAAGGLRWWQFREVLVGFLVCPVVALLSIVVYTMARQVDEDVSWLFAVVAFVVILVFAIPFYLTTEPIVAFWGFLGDIVGRILRLDFHLRVEEWFALFLILWWAVRFVYAFASVKLDTWNAKRTVEEALRHAVEHPFVADLEQGFGQQTFGRALSGALPGGDASASAEPAMAGLKEKRKQLAERARALQGHAEALPSRMTLKINRLNLLADTWSAMIEKPVSELLAPSMGVDYQDELGSDAGGLTRDWFDSVARALAEGAEDINGASLLVVAPDQTLMPRPIAQGPRGASAAEAKGSGGTGEMPAEGQVLRHDDVDDPRVLEKLRSLLAVGRFLALAVYKEQPLPLSFSLVACKNLLGAPVGMMDVKQLDPEFYRGRVEAVLKEGGLEELEAALGEPLTFMSAPSELRPQPEELKDGGANLQVTDDNKIEYVQLLCEAYLCGDVRRELACLHQGFYALLPLQVLRQCNVTPREISVLISGVRDLDPADWRMFSKSNQQAAHVEDWFWEIVEEFNSEQRCLLLCFATGSSRLPPGGFAALEPSFNLTVIPGPTHDHLPVAHTCANQIDLHEYQSREEVREKLLLALASTEGFHLI